MNTPKDEETLFAAALRLTAEERGPYLDEACGKDGPLRRRLEALLEAYAASEEVLEKPAAPVKAVVAWFIWPSRRNRSDAGSPSR